jgi:valyl-tRNA synthetase
MALVVGTTPGNDVRIDKDKIKGYRNFANKVWNIARFILSKLPEKYSQLPSYSPRTKGLTKQDKQIINKLSRLIAKTTKNLENYQLSPAGEDLYQFIWHELADKYLESTKDRLAEDDLVALSVLRHLLINCLKLLHPFMPFVTEEIWSKIPRKYQDPLIISQWPKN